VDCNRGTDPGATTRRVNIFKGRGRQLRGCGGDLAIDAAHLKLLADEQKIFDAREASKWQDELGLSNNEAADLLHISLSSWNSYKAGTAPIPTPLAMLCRAILRDPILVQAHLRPRRTGRPRKRSATK
jgi:hypothetical protein